MINKKMLAGAIVASVSLPLVALGAFTANAAADAREHGRPSALKVRTVLSGHQLTHRFMPAGGGAYTSEPLTGPDDLTHLGAELFVAFQNGIHAQGQPSSDANTYSTVVAFNAQGRVLGQWDLKGHVDGLSADPGTERVIATVNEDANSSLYVIDPAVGILQHYTYNHDPLPHNGGTDAISIYGDRILISASAPGTSGQTAPQSQYPAVYSVSLDPQTMVASVSPLFSTKATAIAADAGPDGVRPGNAVTLGLTDPDSNEVVPRSSPRFAGDFVLDSQGDQQQVYVSDPGGPVQQLSVLFLSQSINDTAWATDRSGALYATDASSDTVDSITGNFDPGTAFVAATPCDANNAPTNCAANFLGTLNLHTGQIGPVLLTKPTMAPGGLLFVASVQHAKDNQQ